MTIWIKAIIQRSPYTHTISISIIISISITISITITSTISITISISIAINFKYQYEVLVWENYKNTWRLKLMKVLYLQLMLYSLSCNEQS